MKLSELFPKTLKAAPKDAESINHKLLVRAGFIDQLMAGSWTLLPLGWRVLTKINDIIREEMNAIGGQEMLMPLMTPKSVWDETGRWETAKEVMYQFKDPSDRHFGLAFTHEEIVLDLLRKKITTYRDLPVALYHFSTKFRSEARAKSGILRGREFLMKDLYSAHATDEDLMAYYEKVKQAYLKIFKRLGFDAKVIEASGGVFTKNFTHEFQVPAESGEDTIYFCDKCDWGKNKEIFDGQPGNECPGCHTGIIQQAKAIEVGNIFPFGKWYSEKMGVNYIDQDGKKQLVSFGSYGIGPTRVMGTWVEISHDDKGIIWNKAITPFDVHFIDLTGKPMAHDQVKEFAAKKIDVLFDDRDIPPGQKFADADLIGIPVRLVVSEKTGDKIEWKERTAKKAELISPAEALKRLGK